MKWATAAEANFGFDDGTIFKAYQESEGDTIQSAFGLSTHSWEGTPTKLFGIINGHATDAQRKSKWWPTSPAGLTNRIERAAQVLRSQGIHVERGRTRNDRVITIAVRAPA